MRMNHIVCDADIMYENGAVVRTAFVTNLGDGKTVLQTAPSLGKTVKDAVQALKAKTARSLPKYDYPPSVVTAAMLQRYSRYGIEFSVKKSECVQISKLDAQIEKGKSVFGCGLLLSQKATQRHAAAKRAAAEKAAAIIWPLSEREKLIIEKLSKNETN